MKKVVSKMSPPESIGGCVPPRGALVAMDAAATAGGRARVGSREWGRHAATLSRAPAA